MTTVRFIGGPTDGRLVEVPDPHPRTMPVVDTDGRCAGTYYVAPVPREAFALWRGDGDREPQRIGAAFLADALDDLDVRPWADRIAAAVRDVLARGAHPATVRIALDGTHVRVTGWAPAS